MSSCLACWQAPAPSDARARRRRRRRPNPVEVSTPLADTVADYEVFTGRTQTMHYLDIKARVTGYLEKIYFKEGEDVQEGAGALRHRLAPLRRRAATRPRRWSIRRTRHHPKHAGHLPRDLASPAATPEATLIQDRDNRRRGQGGARQRRRGHAARRPRTTSITASSRRHSTDASAASASISTTTSSPTTPSWPRSCSSTRCTPTSTWTSGPLPVASAALLPRRQGAGRRRPEVPPHARPGQREAGGISPTRGL